MSRGPVPSRLSALAALAAAALFAGFPTPAHGERVTTSQIDGSRALLNCAGRDAAGLDTSRRLAACNTALRENLMPEQYLAVYVARGGVRAQMRDYPAALADFNEALRIAPRNPTALFNRGMIQVQMRQNGPAVATLTEALSRGMPSPYLAYYYRGVARERLGDVRGAYEDYSTALDIQPNWAPAEQEMARFAQGRRQELASQVNDPRPH
jgi:tetratricopeptide (TPR) repeat protein